MSSEPLDVLVLGGGITGASIFRDAALRNMTVGLVEAHDFGSGASGRSSKLVHGGLRYLHNLRFRRAWEASHERNLHLDLNDRFVKPVPILIPTYRRGGDAAAKVKVAMWLYQMMSGTGNARRHRFVDRSETLELGPGLENRRLTGGVVYYDGIVDDARWTLETVKDGVLHGGGAVNHAPVVSLVKDGNAIRGAIVRDALEDRAYSIEASTVINATGAWADQVREMDQPGRPAMVRLSKGTHLVLARDDVPLNVSCVFPSPLDDRHLFLIRRDDCFLYGTTDGWHDGSPDDPRPGEVDTAYLLEAIRRFFPGSSLTRSSVLYCYSGYRALPSPKANRSLPWSVGRDDMVEVAQSGLATVVSGKLTTSRSLAERVLDRLTEGADGMDRWSACRTDRVAIGGAGPADAAGPGARASGSGALAGHLETLYARYGPGAREIIAGITADENGPPFQAEVRYVCRNEMACTLEDIVERRVAPLSWSSGQRLEYLRQVAPVIRHELEMDEEEFASRYQDYRRNLRRYHALPDSVASGRSS